MQHSFNSSLFNSLQLTVSPSHSHSLLSSYAKATFNRITRSKDFRQPSKTCHVGMHWIALAEYSHMRFQGFSHFSAFLHYFVLADIATSSIRVRHITYTNSLQLSVFFRTDTLYVLVLVYCFICLKDFMKYMHIMHSTLLMLRLKSKDLW